MSTHHHHHHRSPSQVSNGPPRSPTRSSSPPTQIFHSSSILHSVPTPALVESVAGGAHYAGARVDPESTLRQRRVSVSRSHTVLKHDHEHILDDLIELYSCRPTLEIFERSWSKDAVFEGPYCKCKGYDQYTAMWFAFPKVFSKSETISKRIMSSTDNPNQFIYQQTQQYVTRLFKKKKVIESIIVVDMDDNEKIIRLTDRWQGKDLSTRFGASFLRSLSAKLTPWIIHVPKAPAQPRPTSNSN